MLYSVYLFLHQMFNKGEQRMTKDTQIGFRIEESMKAALEQEARQKDIPLAQLIRAILKQHLEEGKNE